MTKERDHLLEAVDTARTLLIDALATLDEVESQADDAGLWVHIIAPQLVRRARNTRDFIRGMTLADEPALDDVGSV